MSFDKETRNLLAKTVTACRRRLTEDVIDQLRGVFGLHPDGTVLALEEMTHLSPDQTGAARHLRDLLFHFAEGSTQYAEGGNKKTVVNSSLPTTNSLPLTALKAAYERMTLEISFTILNRLAALRLCEERGLVIECVRKGTASDGFRLFERISGGALGGRYDTYRVFLECLFDELALDLGVLFDRMTPQSAVFPSERCMEDVLAELNKPELSHLWTEDETIGWVYQYFNPPEERKAMRDASQAPRNSRELAVRNQFFTPRYVVEFLTDNTLGRIWYEMRKGDTALKDNCRYLVRRPSEVFLAAGEEVGSRQQAAGSEELSQEYLLKQPVFIEYRQKKDPRDLKILDPACGSGHFLLYAFDLLERIYEEAWVEQYAVCRMLYAEGEEHEREELSGPDRLAEGDGPCENDLQSHKGLSQRGSLRTHGANPQGSGFNTLEYSGGSGTHVEQGVSELFVDSARFGSGSGNANPDSSAPELPADRTSTTHSESSGRGRPIDQGALELALKEIGYDYTNSAYRPLPTAYSSRDAFLRAVPKLIIEHNLHGIDIDPRAVQIAALALWLRAQKTWKNLNIKAAERPQVTKSNIVTAEPMPGEEDMKKEFTSDLKPRVLGQLVDVVFDKMKLAGEAGSLLKIEEEIKDAVADARKQWMEGPKPEQMFLFPDMVDARPKQLELRLDFKGVTDERFWEQAEERILDALRDYAIRAEARENGLSSRKDGKAAYRPLPIAYSLRRRLFAEDAARGFAFIDLCRKRYDVVLMNPPFGEVSDHLSSYLARKYPAWNKNILCSFIEQGYQMSYPNGATAAIYDRTAVVKSTYGDFRRTVLVADNRLCTMADLGWGVLDANVEITTSVLHHKPATDEGVFINCREIDVDEKGSLLEDSINGFLEGVIRNGIVCTSGSSFQHLPNAVLGYDFPSFLITAFESSPSLEKSGLKANQGFALKAEKHFRAWWEVAPDSRMVINRMFNGAGYSPFVTTLHDVAISPVEPENLPMDSSTRKSGIGSHRKMGICFGKRGDFFCTHVLPKGHVFTVEGQSIPINDKDRALEVLALLNTPVVRFSLNKYCGQHKYSGYVNLFPYRRLSNIEECRARVEQVVDTIRDAQRFDESQSLFSIIRSGTGIADRASFINRLVDSARDICFEAETFCHKESIRTYKLSNQESTEIEAFRDRQPNVESPISDVDLPSGCKWFSAHSEISAIVGIIFGRWDIRIALDPSLATKLPDPFDPLPVCPPGMLVGPDGLPAEPGRIVSEEWLKKRAEGGMQYAEGKWTIAEGDDTPPAARCLLSTDADYPVRVQWDGILVEDSMQYAEGGRRYHKDDIVVRVREVLEVLFPGKPDDKNADCPLPTAYSIEQEACDVLGVSELRDYFRKPTGFFQDHLKRYSKSRRKAPIYQPLSTASGSYTLWLYYHRLTDQTLYAAVNKYVEPKIAEVQNAVSSMQNAVEVGARRAETEPPTAYSVLPTGQLRRYLEEARAFLNELEEFREELLRVAQLPYKPNLNDGVIINAAPLHNLFRLRSWANDTREVWNKLKRGDYDWAHLAYTIWPERVRDACRKDRSIAIAHGLEDICEVEAPAAEKKRGRGRRENEKSV